MEENKHKRSKALIITIICIILLLLFGYLIFKNRDVFGVKTSATIAKIFSPLIPSDNSKNLNKIDQNSKKILVQALEDVQKGKNVSVFGTGANNMPLVRVTGGNDIAYGFANQDIANGDIGEVTINSGGSNTFWDSFSNFLGNLFNTNKEVTQPPAGGWAMDTNGGWVFNPNGTGGWVYNSTNDTWAPPSGVTLPPNGGWAMDTNGGWVFNPNGTGGWVYDTGTGGWVAPGGNNGSDYGTGSTCSIGTSGTYPNCICNNGASNPPLCTIISDGTPGLPNLVAGNITPTSTTINTPTTLSSMITNIGNGGTGSSFLSFFSITSDTGVNIELNTVVLALGVSIGNVAKISYSFSSVGKYSIRACADKSSSLDTTGTIAESNEDNNCGPWTTLTVTNSLALPEDCLSPKITDTATGECIDRSACLQPKVIVGNTCDDSTDTTCLYPKVTDTATSECIDPGACKSPKVVNGTKCEIPPNLCKDIEDNPLTFTPEEKARLAVLLRKFYLVSSTLRTVDDISTIYNEVDQQKNFISQIEDLTNQCYCQVDEIASNGQTGCKNLMATHVQPDDWARHGNPWYNGTTNTSVNSTCINGATNPPDCTTNTNNLCVDGATNPPTCTISGGTFPYTNKNEGYLKYLNPATSQLEGATTAEQCKVVSGYLYGTMSAAVHLALGVTMGGVERDCSIFNIFPQYGICLENTETKRYGKSLPDKAALDAGCKWKDGVDLQNTERILNIW